jgi:hypothetical protein
VRLSYQGSQDYKSKKIRVNLDQPTDADAMAESSGVLKAVDEGRNYVIQATIIRYALLHPTQANVLYETHMASPAS